MKTIGIITITHDRDFYLQNLLESIKTDQSSSSIEHHIVFNGTKPSKEIERDLEKCIVHFNDTRLSVGKNLNTYIPKINTDLIIKMDDDCILRSPWFFDYVEDIADLVPHTIFSPYPVGLIHNAGGPKGSSHFVLPSKAYDQFYTFRCVDHIGGFARISPKEAYEGIIFGDCHNEDVEFSHHVRDNGYSMLYLENTIIVEHQESTLGQYQRYGKQYFGERMREKN